jgi:hypothetical protein
MTVKKKRKNIFRRGFWNHAQRVDYYTKLKKKFGPYSEWHSPSKPPEKKGNLKQYQQQVGNLYQHQLDTPADEWRNAQGALNNQLAFAVTTQPNFGNQSMVLNWMGNVIAAKEAGFITNKHIPDLVLK